MREEGAERVGGVMHCFTESMDVAEQAMGWIFIFPFGYRDLQEGAGAERGGGNVPLERMLIETDSPYLAPVPYRGKTNEPAYVRHVAEYLSSLKGIPLAQVAEQTTSNFFKLFKQIA